MAAASNAVFLYEEELLTSLPAASSMIDRWDMGAKSFNNKEYKSLWYFWTLQLLCFITLISKNHCCKRFCWI